jgi:hypothetical protein
LALAVLLVLLSACWVALLAVVQYAAALQAGQLLLA